MATEKWLIDGNALMEAHVWKCGGDPYDQYYMGYQDALDNVETVIENLPTVDAVEVIRCKDCKHRKEWINYGQFYCGHETDGMASGVNLRDDDFCSYGERKDNG